MVSGEKRNNEEANLTQKITVILLDIEGTTTSVSFVKDKLFPYVEENLESYLASHWNDPEFKEDIKLLKEQAKIDEEAKIDGFCPIEDGEKERESLMKNVLWQMSIDRKTTALKQLQGRIWRDGYKDGKLKGHLYGDVAPMLKKWSEEGRKIYIFSSGSTEAQKLLFGHSEEGDLLPYISGYFDTSVGPKIESNSYLNIIKAIGCEKENILFLTDIVKEAQAARAAGMEATLVLREGNAPLTDDEKQEFATVSSFKDIVFENSSKRKKICDLPKEGDDGSNLSEKEIEPEDSGADVPEKSHINGNEAMEVDQSNEPKSECIEPGQNDTEKTANNENKTDYEPKTDSEDIEIDVVSEDRKEENVETCNVNSNGADADKKSPDAEEEEEKKIEMNSVDVEVFENSAKEETENCTNSELQVEVADPISESHEMSDPLDITNDKIEENKNNVPEHVESEVGDGFNNEVGSTKNPNGTEEIAEKKDPEVEFDGNNEKEASDKETNSTVEKADEKIDSVDNTSSLDKKDSSEVDVSKSPKTSITQNKETNGESAYGENSENNDEEQLGINNMVTEDKPDPTVEVKA